MKKLRHALYLILCAALSAACSVTDKIPDDELFYLGTKGITYIDQQKRDKAGRDSVGVITSIAEAVEAVDALVSGSAPVRGDSLAADTATRRPPSREERARRRMEAEQEQKAFETAKAEIDAVLSYPPNGSLFGSSSLRWPVQPGLWIYSGFADKRGKLGRWVFRNFAKAPVLVSTVNPDVRVKVATNTLRNYGYFNAEVDYDVLPAKNPKKARLAYNVRTRQLYRLDSIAYVGFPPVADSLIRATSDETLLHRGDAFNVVNLSGERTRLEKLFRENGFYYYAANYTTYRADTFQVKNRVQLQMRPLENIPARVSRRWYIGNTHVTVRNNPSDTLTTHRTFRNFTYDFPGSRIPLRYPMWWRAVSHRRGELYSLTHQQMTLEKLNAIGVFSQLDVNYLPRDTSATCDTLDIYINAVMDKLYDSNFEVNATFKSNQQVGPGVSFGLAKRNAFRGGEKVSFDIYGSYEWQTGAGRGDNSLLNSYELGTKLSFDFPRFVFPGMGRRHVRFPGSTVFAVDADWTNRAGFFNMVNAGVSATYKWHRRSNSRHELALLDIDYDHMLSTTATFDSIMTENPALSVSMRNQFVPSVSYMYTYTSPAGRHNPVWFQATLKEAGNLTSAIYALAGHGFNQRDKELLGNPYAQFIKATAEVHKSFELAPKVQVATRLFGGVIYSYGNSLQAPYADQFYVGGANSVRAFTVRTVGPGSFRTDRSRYSYMDQTGDVKLEANVELRFPIFGSLYGAAFLDAGNVWLLRDDPQRPGGKFSLGNLRRIAVGTGVGLRYDLSFIVVRLDYGIALHAPYDTARRGWYNIERFSDGNAFHFAIGYPF